MKEPLFTTAAWHCIRTQPKSEHIAAAHLRLLNEVEVFCPRLRFRRMTRRGPVWFAEALFPGYLFARFTRAVSQHVVAAARGVSSLVRFGGEPATLPDESIEELRAQVGEEECRTIDAEVREGDQVTITSGVFMGLRTVVTELRPARERVRVLMEFLGECREVEVSKENLLPERTHLLAI
jgi:transcription elongation factor/antiterminator RfaH